jgi:hypothetical protein
MLKSGYGQGTDQDWMVVQENEHHMTLETVASKPRLNKKLQNRESFDKIRAGLRQS